MIRRKIVVSVFITVIGLFLASIVSIFIVLKNENFRIAALRWPIAQFAIHTYRSLMKITDLPYFIYLTQSDTLPIYEIVLDPKKIATMNEGLPQDMIKGRLTDEYKIKERAIFRAYNYQDKVSIRYRGRGPNHWNALKKSYQIDFPIDNVFPYEGIGYSEVKFNIPEDRKYVIEPLNFYRSQKLGLFAPQPWFTKLKLNGQNIGVYFTLPHWSKEFVEARAQPDTSNIFGIIDVTRQETLAHDFYNPKNIDFWKDYIKTILPETDKTALQEFLTVISYAPDTLYKKALPVLIDMDSLYSWIIINTLASSSHQNTSVNIILMRNPSTGKFQPIPWDAELYPYEPLYLQFHPLIGRTLAIPAFREEFLKRLRAYVKDKNNLDDDLAFYDRTTKSIRIALFKDNAKAPTNREVVEELVRNREQVIKNFNTIRTIFENHKEDELTQGKFIITPQSDIALSPFLISAIEDPKTFVKNNQKFYLKDSDTLAIGPGSFYIPSTVILPSSVHLEIQPGTTLYLGKEASLVVFHHLMARGTQVNPITIKGASSEPWGSLLVLGTHGEESSIDHMRVSGGKGFHQNAILATAMIAIHNNNARITNSIFENSNEDDALNVKNGSIYIEGNVFHDTFGDAIDIDVTMDGKIINNSFNNIGSGAIKTGILNGDAIDISFSKVDIVGNIVNGCGDKGVSVGERSHPFIYNNLITNCSRGISVKDGSETFVENNYFIKNEVGIEGKRKKPLYLIGGTIHIKNSIIWGNKTDIQLDNYSKIVEDLGNIIQGRDDPLPNWNQTPIKFLPYLTGLK